MKKLYFTRWSIHHWIALDVCMNVSGAIEGSEDCKLKKSLWTVLHPWWSSCHLNFIFYWDTSISDLCAIQYSLGDAPTALKYGDEACLYIWHLMWKLSTASANLSCELLTDKIILLTKCSLAIWFLTIWTTWEISDFAWENSIKAFRYQYNTTIYTFSWTMPP